MNRNDWLDLAGKPITLPLLAVLAAILAAFVIGVMV